MGENVIALTPCEWPRETRLAISLDYVEIPVAECCVTISVCTPAYAFVVSGFVDEGIRFVEQK